MLEGGPVVLLWKFYFINAVIIHFVDLMDGLRETPGREALKLRSEVSLILFYPREFFVLSQSFLQFSIMLLLNWISIFFLVF